MKAESLRVGNFVKHRNIELQVCQIFVDSFQGMFVGGKGSYTYENSDAIPLTEEWLVKFGFTKYETGIEGDKMVYYDFGKLTICNWGEGLIMSNAFAHGLRVPLHFVHQLQNLYFALTGEELTPNKTDKK